MCTSLSYRPNDHYFGRNLDIEYSYNEQVVITPRRHLFHLRSGVDFHTTYALIGIASVMEEVPLYYEAANEAGLAAAGLNFPGNAVYAAPKEGVDNITPFELIPWILGQAGTVAEVRGLLSRMNLSNIPFSSAVPLAPLHFMFSDGQESLVLEPTAEGLQIYDDPYDVMTNNPPFPFHLDNMHNYLNLSPSNGSNQFSRHYPLRNYGVGMGAIGLPGDASSASRFVRTAFHLTNSRSADSELDHVGQVFHILDSVAMLRGCTITDEGKDDLTLYSCCINVTKGIFYYKTYANSQINAVCLHNEPLDGDQLIVFPLQREPSVHYAN